MSFDLHSYVEERLLSHRRITETGCWEWTGGTNRGRGQTRILGERFPVHRLAAFVWLDFDLDSDLQINHGPTDNCDNRLCFNPAHIYVGTQTENIHDMYRRKRWKCKNPRRGEQASSAKLTQAQVTEMIELRLDGWSLAELEKRYGVQRPQISRICNGKRWAHLGLPKTPASSTGRKRKEGDAKC